MNGQQTCNLSRFQDLAYTENADLAAQDIHDGEMLHDDYEIYRKDRESRAGGVLLETLSFALYGKRQAKKNFTVSGNKEKMNLLF